MDRLKKARRPLRSTITRLVSGAEQELQKEKPDEVELRLILVKLRDVEEKIGLLDQEAIGAMIDSESTDEQQDEELVIIEEYVDKIRRARFMIEKVLAPTERPLVLSPIVSEAASYVSRKQKCYKLPKIEIRKFNGELKEWIGFWSQFQKIHEDEDLHVSDKFQYLVQSMVKGSRAANLVESYPQSSENYENVIKALKNRFGDKVLLSEVYVRELLKFVNTNFGKTKGTESLASMYDQLESHLRSLESLGIVTDESAIFLYPMIESSLPEEVIKVWQRSSMSGYNEDGNETSVGDRLKQLMKFLEFEVKGAERLAFVKNGLNDASGQKKQFHKNLNQQSVPTAAGLHVGEQIYCIFCSKPHASKNCWAAKKMTMEERQKKVRDSKSCFSCFKIGHRSINCKSGIVCQDCGGHHATLLCRGKAQDKERSDKKVSSDVAQNVSSNLACSSKITLMTLMVTVIGENGMKRKVRALIDSGSHRTYVSQELSRELKLKRSGGEFLQHNVFGGTRTDVKRYDKFIVRVQHANGVKFTDLEALGEDKICGEISRLPFGLWMNELKRNKIWINDVGKGSPEIELMFGADTLPLITTDHIVRLKNGLRAEETLFGWTLIGELIDSSKETPSVAMQVTSLIVSDATVEQLWKLESIGIRDPVESKSKAEKDDAARMKFLKTVTQDVDGRYSVRLPWIDGVQKIPTNRIVAEKRLQSMTRKLTAEGMFAEYDKILKEWLEEGIIEEVSEADLAKDWVHHIPHRAVVKPGSLTTPVRPVFDASCKVGRNPSLNDCLEKGPNLLELIPSIVSRFRIGRIGVISDIRKAFLMVEIKEADRDFLRFLWWADSDQKEIKTFRHRRVVFGLNCGPFLLGAVIEYHVKSADGEFKHITDKILKSLYVDNCVTSVNSYEEYEEFKFLATKLMGDAKMDLRMWQYNSVEGTGVGSLSSSECRLEPAEPGLPHLQSITDVLGLKWDLISDCLSINVNSMEPSAKITKRVILSIVQKIFDPMGFLCPVLLFPKKLLQETWSMKTSWDEEVKDELKNRFEIWVDGIRHLDKIKIPRCITGGVIEHENWQIHTFCDASQYAYAAAVFLRVDNGNGNVDVSLIQAKSRVAPLKKVTIPRLELLACAIGARLTASVKSDLAIGPSVPVFLWSDSTTALAWIKRNDEWGTFVGNRVREICTLTETGSWRHVPGVKNPADLPSRGCTSLELLEFRWWEGPDWLKQSKRTWPSELPAVDDDDVNAERKKSVTSLITAEYVKDPWYVVSSSFIKNVKIIAWIKRFIENARLKSTGQKIGGELTVEEIDSAERLIMKLVQSDSFKKEDRVLSGIKTSTDGDGILRVKSKLLFGKDDFGYRCPILLPHEHPLVDQLIRHEHYLNGHGGAQFLMAKLREKFWILKTRKAIRRVIAKCVICRRFTSKKTDVVEPALPVDRINIGHVFEVVGIDLAGPLFVKGNKKCWIVLITCATYRCIHLELVKTISTEDFLDAFSRFCNRRGRPSIVYSDNGTNFVGADNLFKKIDWDRVQKVCQLKRIIWKFNPPSAPWWGGWWERLIRSVKDVLKRTLGRAQVSFDKLFTYVCDAEAFVNGRPLTTVTEDLDDLIPLTPAMFIQEIPYSSYTDLDFMKECDFREQLERRKNILDEFKMRFRREYLALLVQRRKEKVCKEFKIGDVVLIGSDNKKRIDWPLGKIVELFPGRDGEVRVAKVKTSTGFMLRPMQRLFSLEVSSPMEIPKVPRMEIMDHGNQWGNCGSTSGKLASSESDRVILKTKSGREVRAPSRFQD